MVRIPLSPPGIKYLTLWLFLSFGWRKFFRRFRGFALIQQQQFSCGEEFLRHLPRATHARLVSAIQWYGGLPPGTGIRDGRARRKRETDGIVCAPLKRLVQTRGLAAARSNRAVAACRPSDGALSVQADVCH
jgi:hypothetical protein